MSKKPSASTSSSPPPVDVPTERVTTLTTPSARTLGLTEAQFAFVEIFAQTGDVEHAASHADVAVATGRKWLRAPKVQQALFSMNAGLMAELWTTAMIRVREGLMGGGAFASDPKSLAAIFKIIHEQMVGKAAQMPAPVIQDPDRLKRSLEDVVRELHMRGLITSGKEESNGEGE